MRAPLEEPFAQVEVALVLRLDARSEVRTDLWRPYRERFVEVVSGAQNPSGRSSTVMASVHARPMEWDDGTDVQAVRGRAHADGDERVEDSGYADARAP